MLESSTNGVVGDLARRAKRNVEVDSAEFQLEYALLPRCSSFAVSSPDEDPLILEIDVVDAELL